METWALLAIQKQLRTISDESLTEAMHDNCLCKFLLRRTSLLELANRKAERCSCKHSMAKLARPLHGRLKICSTRSRCSSRRHSHLLPISASFGVPTCLKVLVGGNSSVHAEPRSEDQSEQDASCCRFPPPPTHPPPRMLRDPRLYGSRRLSV